MQRIFSILLVLPLLLVGCNDHPLKQVEFKNFGGNSDAGGDSESGGGDSESGDGGSASGNEDIGLTDDEGSDGDSDGSTDGGLQCGNGIVEDDEQCDEGEDNGPPPAACNEQCFWNIA